MKRDVYVHFHEDFLLFKSNYLILFKMWRNVCWKPPTLYELVFVFFFLGFLEIVLRIIWIPTPLSFLLPVCILAMYLRITDRPVAIIKRWYLLLPFFLFSFLLCYLLIFTPTPDALRIWLWCFLFAYLIEVFLCILPVIVGVQKSNCYEYGDKKLFFIQFLSFLQLFGALSLFTILDSGKINLLFLNDINNIITTSWDILLILSVSVLTALQYLIFMKKSKTNPYPLSVRIDSCKKEIIHLFNEQRIYLNHNLTFKMLLSESNVEKEDLVYFFNEYIGKSFQYFVAEYRVANAINLIIEKGDSYTLEAIGYESGFRCRASFNKYFKLITGMLPSQYLQIYAE